MHSRERDIGIQNKHFECKVLREKTITFIKGFNLKHKQEAPTFLVHDGLSDPEGLGVVAGTEHALVVCLQPHTQFSYILQRIQKIYARHCYILMVLILNGNSELCAYM